MRRLRASVGDLHGHDPFSAGRPAPGVVWCDPTDDALVLGSRQAWHLADAGRCAAAGLSIVRRRSGGGAVVVERGAVIWVDIVVAHGVAPDDVRGSMVWAGERWRRALGELGVGPVELHGGAVESTPWSDLVCFAGIGPGELRAGGRKLLGLSQRRTRNGLRIQGTLYRRPPSVDVRQLLAGEHPQAPLPEPAYADLDPAAVAAAVDAAVEAASAQPRDG